MNKSELIDAIADKSELTKGYSQADVKDSATDKEGSSRFC